MAGASTQSQTGLYLYGITFADKQTHFMGGVEGADVSSVVEGGVAAVVSPISPGKVRPQRANLAAHHRVLHDLADDGAAVLPVVFGSVTGGEDELRRFLRDNQDPLRAALIRIEGKVEMGMKVFWDIPNVFEYFVASHKDLESMRNHFFRTGRTPSVEEKVKLGETFVSLLQKARERHTKRVIAAVKPCSVEVRTIDPGEERMIMKLACLVERGRQADWEEGVRQAAALFDENYRFDYSGPWPPYNFTDVDLTMD